jgi:hypothetical protein
MHGYKLSRLPICQLQLLRAIVAQAIPPVNSTDVECPAQFDFPRQLLAATYILGLPELILRGSDDILPEEEVQLGRMFLHVTHVVQL